MINDIDDKKRSRAENDFLRCLFEKATEAPSHLDFIQIIVNEILPKTRSPKLFSPVYSKWLKDRNIYFKEIYQLDKNTPSEIEQVFLALKEILTTKKFLKNPSIMFDVCSIEKIFQEKEKYSGVSYSYIDAVDVRIQSLLVALLDLGVDEVVREYAKIKVIRLPMVNIYTGEWEIAPRLISEFTFAPSLRKKRKLGGIFHSNKITDVWVAVELIFLMERCWNERSIDQLEPSLHDYWSELDALKKDNNHVLLFFNREKILSCLNTIFQEMLYDNSNVETISIDDFSNSLLKLDLTEKQGRYYLTLEVNSFSNSNFPVYQVHAFQDDKSAVFHITSNMFNVVGQQVNIIEACKSDGVKSVAKYFERAGLKGVLGKIFFEKNRLFIKLKTQVIRYNSLSLSERGQLQNTMSKLKIFKWSH